MLLPGNKEFPALVVKDLPEKTGSKLGGGTSDLMMTTFDDAGLSQEAFVFAEIPGVLWEIRLSF
jgi:hypothetical protein